MAYVYRHIRLDKNEPFYIGIGNDINHKRAKSKTGRSLFWKKIVNKTDYKVEILLDDIDRTYACEKEIEFIALYGRRNLNNGTLVNLTDGGEGSNNVIYSEKRKLEYSIAFKGENNPMFGKNHSDETKETLRKKAIGKKHTVETKMKMSEDRAGVKNSNYGNRNSETVKLKMSQNRKNKIYIYNTENGVIYDSIKQASESYNISYDMLKLKLYGKCKNNTYLRYA